MSELRDLEIERERFAMLDQWQAREPLHLERLFLQEDELHHDPPDWSALGGPEDEPAYGRTRALDGHYPFNRYGGPYDRDDYPPAVERGGYMNKRASHYLHGGPGQ